MSSTAKGYSLYAKNKYLVEQSSVRIIDSARRDDPVMSTAADFSITLDGDGLSDVVGVQVQSAMIPNPLTVINAFNDTFVFSTGFGCRRASTKVKLKLRHKNYVIQDLVTTTLGDLNPNNIELNAYNLATLLYTYGVRVMPTLESDSFHGDLNYLTFTSLFPFVIDAKNSTAAKVFGFGDVARDTTNPLKNTVYDWSKNGFAAKVFYKGDGVSTLSNTGNHYLHGSIGLTPITDVRGLYATSESLSVNSVNDKMASTYTDVVPLYTYNEPSSLAYVPPSNTDTTTTSGNSVNYFSGTNISLSDTFPSKMQLPYRQLTDSFSSWTSPRIPTYTSGISGNWYSTFSISGRPNKRAGGPVLGGLTSLPTRDGTFTISNEKWTVSVPSTDDAMFTLDISPSTALVKGSYKPTSNFTTSMKSDISYGANYTSNLTLAHQRHTRLAWQSNVILDGLTIDIDPTCDLVMAKYAAANLVPGTALDVIEYDLKWEIHDFTTPTNLYHTPSYYYAIEDDVGGAAVPRIVGEERVWLDDNGYVVRLDVTDKTVRTVTSVSPTSIIKVVRQINNAVPVVTSVEISTFRITVSGALEKTVTTFTPDVTVTTTVIRQLDNPEFVDIPVPPTPFTYTPRFLPLKWAVIGLKTIGYVEWARDPSGIVVICDRLGKSTDPTNSDWQYAKLRYRTPWKAIDVDAGYTTSTVHVVNNYVIYASTSPRWTETTGSDGIKTVVETAHVAPGGYLDGGGAFTKWVPALRTLATGDSETTSVITNYTSETPTPMNGIPTELQHLYCPRLFRTSIDDEAHLLKEGVCRIISYRPTLSSAPDFYTTINGSVANANVNRTFLDLVGIDGITNPFTDEITNMIGYVDWQFESNRAPTLASHLNACRLYMGEVHSAVHKFEKATNSIRRIRVTIKNNTGYNLSYHMASSTGKRTMMMNPNHSNNITLSNILISKAQRTLTGTAPNYTQTVAFTGPLYGYPNVEAHFQYYPGTIRTPNLAISAKDARAYYYNNVAALDSNDTTVAGDDFNTMCNFFHFAGWSIHLAQAPNYVNFIPTKRLVLRCPQLESHIDTTTLSSAAPTGIAIFAVTSTAKIYNTMEGISLFIAGNYRFQPINKLTKLTFRIENESGQVVDMGGLDYYISILFFHLVHNRFIINDAPMALASDIDEMGENVAHEDDELDDAFINHLLDHDNEPTGKMTNEKIRVVNMVESTLYSQFGESMSVVFAPDKMVDLPALKSSIPEGGFVHFPAAEPAPRLSYTIPPPSRVFTE